MNVHCNSMSFIHLSKNRQHHERTKHVDVKYHLIRDVTKTGLVVLVKVHTEDNPTDMETKRLVRIMKKHQA